MPDASELEAVMRYHERTKHHFNRFAAGPGQLDWANQPDPFRRYAGAALTRLPVLDPDEEPDSPAYESLYALGAIGQVLYLEAEAAGMRSTGIGCFFDDPVHQVFGLKDLAFQSLYYFTVGGYGDDSRLTTLPAYGRRVKSRQRGMDLP